MNPESRSQDASAYLNKVDQELRARLSQQEAIARLGQQALHTTDLDQLIEEVVNQVVTILGVEYSEILELLPERDQLFLKAGVGWRPGYVGQARLGIGSGSQGGFTIQAGEPVIVEDLNTESRFSAPALLLDHEITSGMTVIISGRERPYGILGVHTRNRWIFSTHDANFLQNIANLLASAITRLRIEQELRASRDQLAVVLEGIAEGITVQDRSGRLVFANNTAAQLFGFENPAELLETPPSEVIQKFEIFDEQGDSLPIERLPGPRALLGEKDGSEIVRFRVIGTGEERWSMVRSSPVFGPSNQVELAISIFQDITELKRDEQSQRFMAEVGDILVSSPLDYRSRLEAVAGMAARSLSDWCVVHLIEPDKGLQQVAVAHKDAEKVKLTRELQEKYPPDPESNSSVYKVLQSGEAEYFPKITDAMLAAAARDPEHLRILRSLNLCSAVILPLVARNHTLGVITLVWGESKRQYEERELFLGKELARRAALAIDNVSLFQEVSSLNAKLESKVTRRTAQLERTIDDLRGEIIQRYQAEKELERNETLLSDLFELSPDAVFLVDRDGMIVRINAQGEEMFGHSRSELLGQPIDRLLPERFRAKHSEYRESYQEAPRLRSMGADLELYGRRKTGDEFPVDVMLSPVKIEDDWLVICAVRDITAQKSIQAELAEVQHRLLDSQEAERLRLGLELHDNTIQELFNLSFRLGDIEKALSQGNMEEVEKELNDSKEMVQHAILGLRNITGELRPPTLAPFGLEQAIRSHLEQFQELHPEIILHQELTHDGLLLEERVRLSLFRIYQHAVSNVARHAEAKQLWVRLALDSERVILEIQDDGRGFEMPSRWVELARRGHLGLVGTRERVKAIGGQLAVVSSPGKGMLVRVTAPLKQA